ncbi:MAG: hypothetical protein QF701_07375 [Nitrospinota bacterium]|jgi:hypothetical protein|nr:hypothetical protein [Nitrospinota bacterium]MDP7370544.1 hypothetical protein [Nitrospinota bacterium]MDP7504647.1 hypothetical protein [Nitrospinota bacterium]MDP7664985.1 hypothetical protein [Nitrospinota bacterium]|tara:strand:- start:379 stop:639 length:261 start_codon:yes stop_codon:yes gene_type:complete
MMKIEYKSSRVRVEMDYQLSGSVLAGTVKSECLEAWTFFEVDSDAPEERVVALIKNAKQGCFAEAMIQVAVPLKSEIKLNGKGIGL